MPHNFHKSPGDYIAHELILAKSQGQSFLRASLASFIDVRLEQWNQTAPAGSLIDTGPITVTPEAIYQAYPRKVGKKDALKAIANAIKTLDKEHATRSQSPAQTILDATKAYAAAVATWPVKDRTYIPFPATWFNRGSYQDDPKEWARAGAAPLNAAPRDYSKV
jgi:hypothetical protein